LLTSNVPDQRTVLSENSTTTPDVLTQGLTKKQREILFKLLTDLFLDNRNSQIPLSRDEQKGDTH
jgi:hypothetical protein